MLDLLTPRCGIFENPLCRLRGTHSSERTGDLLLFCRYGWRIRIQNATEVFSNCCHSDSPLRRVVTQRDPINAVVSPSDRRNENGNHGQTNAVGATLFSRGVCRAKWRKRLHAECPRISYTRPRVVQFSRPFK
jgi:hypothetical protein